MWDPAGEIPQIVFLRIGNKTLAVAINGRDPRAPVNSTFDGRVLLRKSTGHCQTASYRGQGSRADAQKSATREPVFGAVILHSAYLLQNTPAREIVATLNADQGPHAKMRSPSRQVEEIGRASCRERV